jgi:hypothetical protein
MLKPRRNPETHASQRSLDSSKVRGRKGNLFPLQFLPRCKILPEQLTAVISRGLQVNPQNPGGMSRLQPGYESRHLSAVRIEFKTEGFTQ